MDDVAGGVRGLGGLLDPDLMKEKKEAEDGLAVLYKELEQLEADGFAG